MLRWFCVLLLLLIAASSSAPLAASDAPGASTPAIEPSGGATDKDDDDKDDDEDDDGEDEEEKEAEESKDEDAEDEADEESDDEADESDEASKDSKKADADDEKGSDDKKSDADEAKAEKVDESEKDDAKKEDDGQEEKSKEKDDAAAKKPAKASDEKPTDKGADDKKPAKPAEKKPETFKVKTKDLKIKVESEGVFVAEETEEVALRPETWASFKVLEAVPHGKRVRKGDVLVKFDDKDIEESLADKSLALRSGELALMAAEEEFPRLEKSITLNYDQAKREYEQAVDEKKRFDDTMRELSEKMAKYYLDSAEQDYANANEELQQLQKMYDADELTEETEEIVLKRQKFQVAAAKFFVEYSKINHEYTMSVQIPRREESLKTGVEMAKIEFDRANMAKSLGLNQQRYELENLREARAKAVDSHAKLTADRALMTLKAPADGIAYYGRAVNGRWNEVGSLESKLIPFGTVTPNSVVMTIVKDRPLYVKTSIGEKELPTVKPDQPATIEPVADAELELKGKVVEAAGVPGGGNKFAVRVDLTGDEEPEWLMPGMTGKTRITIYDVKDAIVIPAELVQSDEENPKQKYVMVAVEDEAKPIRRDVKLGKSKEKEVEVLKGLAAGDEIVKGAKDGAEDEEKKPDEKKE